MAFVSFRQHRLLLALFCVSASFGCTADVEGDLDPVELGGAGGTGTAGSGPAGTGAGTSASGGQAGTSAGTLAAAGSGAAGNSAAGSGAAAGSAASNGVAGSAGASAGAPAAGSGGASGAGSAGGPAATTEKFSFFVTSYAAIERLSGSPNGFGGDLRYGEADGLAGADKICTEIAEKSLAGSGAKGWRAFLSVTKGPDGNPVHAIDRVGMGPWYDRLGRVLAMNREDLLQSRPRGADPTIINDFPNEDGVPNHAPDGAMKVDNHDILTGTNNLGQLFNPDWRYTCHDWTSSTGSDGTPRVGHSWPRMGGGFPGGGGRPFPSGGSGGGIAGTGGSFPGGGTTGPIDSANWMSSLNEAGCAPGASLVEMGPPNPDIPTVGSGGGYGGIYCFALKP